MEEMSTNIPRESTGQHVNDINAAIVKQRVELAVARTNNSQLISIKNDV
jgi:hypothetical protein